MLDRLILSLMEDKTDESDYTPGKSEEKGKYSDSTYIVTSCTTPDAMGHEAMEIVDEMCQGFLSTNII